ncbi:MAG: serine/threonine protein kinase [Planctomycetota bacterium]|nr:serine/threonine protein kinase [Planctomycetota bacterium]
MNVASHHSRPSTPPACPACGERLPFDAQFCPGCGRRVEPLKGALDSGIGPRTDQPLPAVPPTTETQTDVSEVAHFLPERYQPLRKLGQGGMGTVYQCLDRALERPVAIKIMTDRYRSDPAGERRFMREARAQAIVNHPNVATVLNFGVSPDGHPFLVMEYLEGQDLRNLLRQEKVIEPFRACDLLCQMCEGLEEAHASGLVHRDMKPSNVMIVKDHRGAPRVKILDLGLAKIMGGQSDLKSISLDTAGLLVGTPAYMSPEQVAGSAVDGRADIYSMGVVLFEMLCGRLPFESETMEGWLYQHLHVAPPPPSQFNPALAQYPVMDRLALWLMAKLPRERPNTAGELALIVRRAVERKLVGDDILVLPAKKSGPRPSLPFEENPPARKSGPRIAASVYDAPPPPPDDKDHPPAPAAVLEQPAPPASAGPLDATEERRSQYVQVSKAAEEAESRREWQAALKLWEEAMPLADRAETVTARIQGCKREMDFEEQLEGASTAATAGDWEAADKALARLASARPSDARIEQARARLPQRLIAAWLGVARTKVMALPEGDLRQALMERLGIAYAQSGDMQNALLVLDDGSRRMEARVVGLAQAVTAAIQNGLHEGLRPYLDRACLAANSLTDPSERGHAQVEAGRALTAYGDLGGAATAFHNALNAFSDANTKGVPIQPPSRRTSARAMRRGSSDMRTIMMTAASLPGPKAARANWEQAVGVVAQAQAEAGLVEDSMASAALIEDAWTLAQTFSQVAQALAKTGRSVEAERVIARIGFALPKAQAMRALAVARVYSGDMVAAEEILKNISAPPDRIAIQGLLAAAWALRAETGRAQFRVAEVSRNVSDLVGARARFQALVSAAEPLLNAGFQELGSPLVTEAFTLMDLMDDPAERLRSMLQLAQVQETAQSARQVATRTIMVTYQPSIAFIELLRRALMVWRQVRQPGDRMECVERLAYSIAWGSAPELAAEVLSTCHDSPELSLAYIGLATGMA